MSKIFPTNKDHIIDDLDDQYDLKLSDEEYERLRHLTQADLFLLTALIARSMKNKEK